MRETRRRVSVSTYANNLRKTPELRNCAKLRHTRDLLGWSGLLEMVPGAFAPSCANLVPGGDRGPDRLLQNRLRERADARSDGLFPWLVFSRRSSRAVILAEEMVLGDLRRPALR